MAAAVAGEVVLPGGWAPYAEEVLVLGLLAGLPHGAADHLVPARRLGWRPGRLLAFAGGYATLATGALLLFRAAPGPALAAFVLLSAWHFGSGETVFADLRAGRPLRARPWPAAVTGGLVLLVPLAQGSAAAGSVVAAVVPGSDGALPAAVGVLAGAVVLPGAVLLAAWYLAGRRWLEAAEVAALAVLVTTVHPLAAFGVYFGAWHSVRHIARAVAEDPRNDGDLLAGRLRRPLLRFAGAAAVPTAGALAVVVLMWSAVDGWPGFIAAALPVLAALTLPHVLVTAWSDGAEARTGHLSR